MRSCGLLLAIPLALAAQDRGRVNPDAAIVADFEKRAAEYAKLHQSLESQLPALKPTRSQEAIVHHEHELARKIRKARLGAKQGDIFSPPIASEFRRLIGIAMQGDSSRIHGSLRNAEPVRLRLRVNQAFPSTVPLQSTPPTLLMNLPKLPPELDYRVLGPTLALRDTKANIVVDLVPNAVP